MNRWRKVKACAVSKEAYDRGYGAPDEITPIPNELRARCSVAFEYLDDRNATERRHNRL